MEEAELKYEKLQKFIPLLEKVSAQMKTQATSKSAAEKYVKTKKLLDMLTSGFSR